MKRYLIIAAAVIVLIGVGVVTYFYFFSGAPTVVVAPNGTASLPDTNQAAPDTSTATTQTPAPTGVAATVSPRLVQISKGPVVPGEVIVDKRLGGASSTPEAVVTYIERQSGNVFTYSLLSKTLTRISNKTLPGIQSASWLSDGSAALVRYLSGDDSSTINTYLLPADGSAGSFLPQNLAGVAVSSSTVLLLASGVNGSVATTQHVDGTHSAPAFSTPLSQIRASFAGRGYLAFTKPSGTLAGDAFLYTSSGSFSRVAGPLNGLVALASPSGKWVLVSSSSGGALAMQLVNTTTGESISLPVATLADKCVWSADEASLYCAIPVDPSAGATYPDDWYQGAVSFNDRIWRISVSGRYAELVLDFSKETKAALDAEALAVDPQSSTLVFVNKNDGSLWSFSL